MTSTVKFTRSRRSAVSKMAAITSPSLLTRAGMRSARVFTGTGSTLRPFSLANPSISSRSKPGSIPGRSANVSARSSAATITRSTPGVLSSGRSPAAASRLTIQPVRTTAPEQTESPALMRFTFASPVETLGVHHTPSRVGRRPAASEVQCTPSHGYHRVAGRAGRVDAGRQREPRGRHAHPHSPRCSRLDAAALGDRLPRQDRHLDHQPGDPLRAEARRRAARDRLQRLHARVRAVRGAERLAG